MNRSPICWISLTTVLMACSAPPEAPSVDDARRRPVNSPLAIDAQRCRGDLSATRSRLTEALNADAVREAQRRATLTTPRVLVVPVRQGSVDFTLPPDQRERVLELVRQTPYIEIRGRTEALHDTPGQSRLAQRRAEAAASYLVREAGVAPAKLHVSWQGAGDRVAEGNTPADRDANRRVEIALYPSPPQREVLAPMPVPVPVASSS